MKKEDTYKRFARVASKRTENVLVALERLGVCHGRNYKYYKEDIDNIFDTIEAQVELCKALFRSNIERSEYKLKK